MSKKDNKQDTFWQKALTPFIKVEIMLLNALTFMIKRFNK